MFVTEKDKEPDKTKHHTISHHICRYSAILSPATAESPVPENLESNYVSAIAKIAHYGKK
jgi:hypothetical protein